MAGVRQTASGVVQTSGGVAQTVLESLIDSFEDGDMGEYTVSNGSSSDFAVVDEANVTPSARDGTKLLQISHGNSSQTYVETLSSSGLDNYPQKGDEIDYWLYSPDYSAGVDLHGFIHCQQDSNNRYYTRYEPGNTQIKFVSDTSTYGLNTTTASVTLSDSTWYRVNIKWDDGATFGLNDGDQQVTVYDTADSQQAQLTHTADDALSGPEQVGWLLQSDSSSDTVYNDYAHL